MNTEEQNVRFNALDNRITDLATQFAQFVNEIRASLVAATPNRDVLVPTPEASNANVRENVAEEIPHQTPVVVELDPISEAISARMEEENKKRFAKLEEKLKAIQGYESNMIEDLSRYAKMDFLEKFEVPDFAKYDGTGDPKESLYGPALQWYILLEPEKMEKWEELAEAFVPQYKYNTKIASTCKVLTCMEKMRNESFGSFAQRWCTLAAQVRPPLDDVEMVKLFLNTLPPDFYNKMIGFDCGNFTRLVAIGERIEEAMHEGRITEGTNRKFTNKEKEVEVAYVQALAESKPFSNPQNPSTLRGRYHNYEPRKWTPRQFTPLPRPLSKLLPKLL
ncbi:uncharacterized protein LOC120287477 [Eucalyptus grandis]|uniref:uncharacterized protein LOC120287477 n=1 Tax=Eucalyptus grandis TaxID=71139 RepID=UPI00192EABE4|nr:uncharacterized protein LOC120287477 [Eucalyptus grandis]